MNDTLVRAHSIVSFFNFENESMGASSSGYSWNAEFQFCRVSY